MLELKNISKTFNPGTVNEKKALDQLSLTLEDGDFVTVIGGNGAGKSTLFYQFNGVEKPTSGQVLVDGLVDGGGTGPLDMCQMTPTQLRQARRSISMIFFSRIRNYYNV
ncbi:MAG: ATP-binding cassette domain-containing protein, partial [Parasporobacterium sp.]|nr:ATP-binding cassette domain-containing protein [Parasporobacterium sp.]